MSDTQTIGQAIGAIADAGKPYLGDPLVVGGLVRKYIAGIVTRWGQYAADEITSPQMVAGNTAATTALAAAIAGKDGAYTPIQGWTGAPDGQDAFLLGALGKSATDAIVKDAGAATAAATSLLLRTYAAIDDVQRSGDEQAYKDALTANVEDGTRLFMGIPSDAELSGDQPE